MTDEYPNSNTASGSDSAASEDDGPDTSDGENIQSLTDLFDQMDRAAFKRALANREVQRETDAKTPKLQRR